MSVCWKISQKSNRYTWNHAAKASHQMTALLNKTNVKSVLIEARAYIVASGSIVVLQKDLP